jgi:D-glycero-D-manno-heptose 1,7-bisphosphate phosphatase
MGGAHHIEALRPAVFLDRDGTLNEDFGYVHRFEDFRWLPGAKDAIRRLNAAGVYVFVVTNQSGVARGLFDEAAVTALHARMCEDLREIGAAADDFRYCPHHPDVGIGPYRRVCACRKPAPGMILDLIAHWPVDKARSVMVGDKAIDAEAGQAAGIAAEIVRGGELEEFVDRFLRGLTTEPSWPGLSRPPRS